MRRVIFTKWSKWNAFCLLLVLGLCMFIIQYDRLDHRTLAMMKPIRRSTTPVNTSSIGVIRGEGLNVAIVRSTTPSNSNDDGAAERVGVAIGHSTTTSKSNDDDMTQRVKVAIGLAIKYRRNTKVTDMAFFDLFLDSFCHTASSSFEYHFFLAYDHLDPFFSEASNRETFANYFRHVTSVNCTSDVDARTTLRWVASPHDGEPARAQNDALMAAYYTCDCDYYFRTIDDSFFTTAGWTEALIGGLLAMRPPNVGMVAPNITHAPRNLLTVEFVHRTHFEIFGYYYPHLFRHWWADTWMNHVYEPDHKRVVQQAKFTHQLSRFNNRARYTVDFAVKNVKYDEEAMDKAYVKRYLVARHTYNTSWPPHADRTKVIAMALPRNDTTLLQGAVRNAQILPVYFPGWTLRLYIPEQSNPQAESIIPEYFLKKLKRLAVDIIEFEFDHPSAYIPPEMYSWLALDDQSLDYVLVRNVSSRLSDRDAEVVRRWMASGSAFHCIRDHPSVVNFSIVPGAFGARPKLLARILDKPIKTFIKTTKQSNNDHNSYPHQLHVLWSLIWPQVRNESVCHDSVSCTRWPNTVPFPVRRQSSRRVQTEKEMESVHAQYDEHHRPAYDTARDNEQRWKPFRLMHLDVMRQCQAG